MGDNDWFCKRCGHVYYLPKETRVNIITRLTGSLSDEDIERVNKWRYGHNEGGPSEIIGVISNAPITQSAFACLRNGEWINDEIINATMKILRGKHLQGGANVVFSSFFYSRLREQRMGYSYDSVRRWTKHINIFNDDASVYIPINVGNFHWFMMVLSVKSKCVHIFDSLCSDKGDYFATICAWLKDEGQRLEATPDRYEGWKLDCAADGPKQQNSYDCGIFALASAEMSMMNQPMLHDQSMMSSLRARIAHEIIIECTNKLITVEP